MHGQHAADEIPHFIDGFEPFDETTDAGESAHDSAPLELPDMEGTDITLMSAKTFYSSGAVDEVLADEAVRPESPVGAASPAAVPEQDDAAPSLLPTSAALEALRDDARAGASQGVGALLEAVYTRWFDDFNRMNVEAELRADIRELAHAAATVTVVDAANMLHDFAHSEFASERDIAVSRTQQSLLRRLVSMRPELVLDEAQGRAAALAEIVEEGDASVRLKSLWQTLRSGLGAGFGMDMYFYYGQPLIDRFRARLVSVSAQ